MLRAGSVGIARQWYAGLSYHTCDRPNKAESGAISTGFSKKILPPLAASPPFGYNSSAYYQLSIVRCPLSVVRSQAKQLTTDNGRRTLLTPEFGLALLDVGCDTLLGVGALEELLL